MNSPETLTSLKYELREAEVRIREDFHRRDFAWLALAESGMRLITRMIAQIGAHHRSGSSEPALEGLPVPDLEPRAIDVEEFRANTPEKFELVTGYLFDTAEHSDSRRRLLALLLVNVGLVEVVRLAPQEIWLEALARAHKA